MEQHEELNTQLPLAITDDHIKFISNFATVLNLDLEKPPKTVEEQFSGHDPNYFRWFDTGDLQDLEMLWCINEIALATPEISHWLPTKEYSMVIAALKSPEWTWAKNLTIRVSVAARNKEPSHSWKMRAFYASKKGLNLTFSQVFDPEKGPNETENKWFVCPALKQGHKCLECRWCWGTNDVAYPWRER